MTWIAIVLGVVVAVAAVAVVRLTHARCSSSPDRPRNETALVSTRDTSSALDQQALDLETVIADANAVLYIPSSRSVPTSQLLAQTLRSKGTRRQSQPSSPLPLWPARRV
jgi:hypothetical protein